MEKKKLTCKIDSVYPCVSGGFNYEYSVWDGDECVSTGTSSDESWVRHDAGGYHTKEKFDKMYPNGWYVEYSF